MPRTRTKMTAAETKRFAHGLAAELVEAFLADRQRRTRGEEWLRIFEALGALGEQHRRFGPKSTDMAPRALAPYKTPLLDRLEQDGATNESQTGGGQ